MQVLRVQNNNYSNLPYFKGKITLLNSRSIPRSLKIKEFQVSQEADEILYDAFIKATGMNYYGVGFGLGNKDSKYLEYVKKLKEISGINTDKIMRNDTRSMYGYSRANDPLLNERSYQIDLNCDKGIIIEHILNFVPKIK